MRILHLLNHTRRLNGHVHAAIDLACAQRKLGHTVGIASGGGDFDRLLAENEIETHFLSHERKPLKIAGSLLATRTLFWHWRPDVVHAHMVTSALLARLPCSVRRIPLITTVHNEFDSAAKFMGLGTRVIAVSGAVRDSMQQRGVAASKLHVILNGTIGAARFVGRDCTPARLSHPAIVFVGGLHPRKGLPDLLKAFAIVHSKQADARLYIVGDGPCRGEYMSMARALPCADAIKFEGGQSNPYPWMLSADVFVLPSHKDPAPLVLSEAREAGCAIIATDVDGIPELLEHGEAGVLVPSQSPEELAAAMSMLCNDPERISEWKKKSQFRVDRLTIDRVAKQTIEVYNSAKDGGPLMA